MDTAQWPQEIVVKPIEEIVRSSCSSIEEKKARPHTDQALNCPRCHSTNTKFCYFNNYSLTQPRYFCKTCRRYWTEGGSLRNIPVGGGSRKNKRSSTPLPSSKKLSLGDHSSSSNRNPTILHPQDLIQATTKSLTDANDTSSLSAMELLAGLPSRGANHYVPLLLPDPNPVFGSGFALHDFKPSLTFSLDVIGTEYDAMGVQDSPRGRNFFPFELETNANVEINKENTADGSGFWSGIVDRHLL